MHLADAFIQRLYIYCQYVCFLGIEPTTFALLTQRSNHWATVFMLYVDYGFNNNKHTFA